MITATPTPGAAPGARRRLLFFGAFAALLALATGCGIGGSVADECITLKRVYERAQKRQASVRTAGVAADTAAYRAAAERLAQARSEYTACAAQRSETSS